MLTDTHVHLDMEEFEGDRPQVLARALDAGVSRMISIGTDLASSRKSIEIAAKNDFVYATVGYHPHHASDLDANTLEELTSLAANPKVVAWGEIGLDFFRRRSPLQEQIKAFEKQLDLAAELGLPVIVHDRDAHDQVLEILRKRKLPSGGVMHCFSGDSDFAEALLILGFHLSIPGTVTYNKAFHVREVASRIPLDRLLLETDAPFLAPEPFRGKRNEPAYVINTAREIANLRNMDFHEIAKATTRNAEILFRLRNVP